MSTLETCVIVLIKYDLNPDKPGNDNMLGSPLGPGIKAKCGVLLERQSQVPEVQTTNNQPGWGDVAVLGQHPTEQQTLKPPRA